MKKLFLQKRMSYENPKKKFNNKKMSMKNTSRNQKKNEKLLKIRTNKT